MARRFRFRLATIQRLRKEARDRQRRVVADRAQAVRALEQRVMQWNEQLAGSVEEYRVAQNVNQLQAVTLSRHQYHRNWLHRKIMDGGVELEARRRELEEERSQLARVEKQFRVIEKLHDRQWARHQAHTAREEQAENDEAAIQIYRRALRREIRDGVVQR